MNAPPGLFKLADQLHLPFVEHSAPDCKDYPWGHPDFCSSSFWASRPLCEDRLRIPILFKGSEQLGDEALQIPVGVKTPVILVQSALVHQCDEAAKAIQCKVQEICALEQFAADA